MFRKLTLAALGVVLAMPVVAADEVVVYSARNEHLIKPLFDRYTEKTGVQISYITDKEGPLLQRLLAEGKRTPADMLITVDAGNLWYAAEQGVLAETDSAVLNANVPANLRDPQGRWFGLSERARTIVYSTERVQPGELSSYEDLADPKWKGRLCLRTSKKVYNQSLVATLIARLGEEKAEQVVR
ncbi:MAG: ABC transporter substrate-binding protein, partial [Gammaproteobacteria bacterium]|nr:ABC transporter substrate-binding protein [Gammaproteobacteria bacterium]